MKTILDKLLPTNRFARSVSILTGGTITGQAIIVLASPLLTRLYNPEDFGLLGVYASLLMTLGVISSLRYHLAIPLPKSDKDAAHILVLSLVVVLVMSILSTALVFVFRNYLSNLINTPSLSNYLWLLPPGLFLIGAFQSFSQWAIRVKAFAVMARTKLAQSLSMVTLQIGGYLLGPIALLLGLISGHTAGLIGLGIFAIGENKNLFRKIRPNELLSVAGRYKRFPLYSTWGSLFNTAGQQLPPILFAAFFSSSIAGIYLLAHRVLAMPMSIIGRSVANVFLSRAAGAHRAGELSKLVAVVYKKLVHISMPLALIPVLAGPDLFKFIFGEDWKESGEFARWMILYIYFQFVTSPLTLLVSVLEKQLHGTIFQLVLFIIQLFGILLGFLYGQPIISVVLFSVGSAICYICFLTWIMHASNNQWSLLWLPTIKSLAFSIVFVIPIIIFYVFDIDNKFWLISILLSVVLIACRYFFLIRKFF